MATRSKGAAADIGTRNKGAHGEVLEKANIAEEEDKQRQALQATELS